ncbi:MAG TPA: hypothetical protein VGO59_03555 [Verrucomicrobiae bacterium]|jgi:hypothetical protein
MKKRLRFLQGSAQDLGGSPVKGRMKTILSLLPLAGAALLLCGCGPDYNFTPWNGPQQNWSTGPGGYVRMVDNVAIYSPNQYPSRPYYVVGAVSTDSEENVAEAVRDKHADAALLSTETTRRTGSIAWAAPGVYGETPITKTVITANIIKYR